MQCPKCHDISGTHIDGEARTYAFDEAYFAPSQSGVVYAAGYRLNYIDGAVPLMIPAVKGTTFGYNTQLMIDTAFRLCFSCHGSSAILDETPGDGIDTGFKASLPNPPRNYSYAWQDPGNEGNEHAMHIISLAMPWWDSDWDTATTGPAPTPPDTGYDSLLTCSSCHNVHGAVGAGGSTNEVMVRDGRLAGRSGYGFSYVIEAGGGYPWVTSDGATQLASVGGIMRNNSGDMCGGDCHGYDTTQADPFNATGSYLEWYRQWAVAGNLPYEHHGRGDCVNCHETHD
jgi:hypothetical protein